MLFRAPGYRFAPPCGARKNLARVARSFFRPLRKLRPACICPRQRQGAIPNELRSSDNPEVVERDESAAQIKKEKAVRLDCFLFLVAEVGFEPHDLRVMRNCRHCVCNFYLIPYTPKKPIKSRVLDESISYGVSQKIIEYYGCWCQRWCQTCFLTAFYGSNLAHEKAIISWGYIAIEIINLWVST